jgi:hypothetical protein
MQSEHGGATGRDPNFGIEEVEMKRKLTLKSVATRAAIVATMAAVMFAMTGFAHADVIPASWHNGNRGTLKLAAPTQVGDVLLPPGAYEVKVKNSATGAVVEFARWTYDPDAAEGLPVYTREVIASVKALPQAGTSASARTGLLLAYGDSGKAVGLQIRGQNADYLF